MNKEFTPVWDDQAPAAAPATVQPGQAQKQIVTIRLDVDTLSWFKSAGPGYQTRMNQVLREHMDANKAKA